MDYVKYEFERGFPSYLRGEWRHGGWWYYYLYAILVKLPVGILVLGVLTLGVTIAKVYCGRMSRSEVFDELVLVVPAISVFALVSSQTGFNHHLRYVLPAFPLLFVWVGKMGRWFEKSGEARAERADADGARQAWRGFLLKRAFVVAMLSWVVGSSLSIYPCSQSYFNELAGGPENGWRHLHNSNIDWGQDLFRLRAWVDDHPNVNELGVALFHKVSLSTLGFNCFEANRYPAPKRRSGRVRIDHIGPQPGWFAISVCHLAGEPASKSYWGRANEDYKKDPSRSYFRFFEPVDRIGYSMNVYHVTVEECNRVRRNLGLKPLPENWRRGTEENAEVEAPSAE
jgi:hypothetical protein